MTKRRKDMEKVMNKLTNDGAKEKKKERTNDQIERNEIKKGKQI